ncbi:MAG: hypothetical protein MJE66_10855 [Proteobacteria bacterium]|nr:hypothetical protein [Pseudomonadota bacterium]
MRSGRRRLPHRAWLPAAALLLAASAVRAEPPAPEPLPARVWIAAGATSATDATPPPPLILRTPRVRVTQARAHHPFQLNEPHAVWPFVTVDVLARRPRRAP